MGSIVRAVLTCVTALFLFFGCTSRKVIEVPVKHVELVTVRDTIIDVRLEPFFIEKWGKDTTSIISRNGLSSKAIWSKGVLYHNLDFRPLPQRITLPVVEKTIKKDVPIVVEKIEYVNKLNKFQLYSIFGFWGCIGIFILYLIKKIR